MATTKKTDDTAGKTTKKATTSKRTSSKAAGSRATGKGGSRTAPTRSASRGKSSAAPIARGNSLVIVESPAKARTITKYLGRGFSVQASMGHVRDLPKSTLGVDVEHNFNPQYVVPRDKSKTVKDLEPGCRRPKPSTWRPTPTAKVRLSPGTSAR